ncbi:MAG: hypothetical protein QNI86_06310 [Halieaceae bacterium]|nr:hypothetical protein [Halieaceae bacterium]
MLGSTISASAFCAVSRTGRQLLAVAAVLLAGCANQVEVQGQFPTPVLDKLPLKIGVYYDPEFRSHEFYDEADSREEVDWIVRTGEAQIEMYNTLLPGMFEEVVMLNELPRRDRVDTVMEQDLDAVLVPHVQELQYSIPNHTKINVFEIWMRYRYELYAPDGELLAEWSMTSYGKTPTAFLQTAEAAVNLAAVVALRDAGANFAMNFTRVPEVRTWMDSLEQAAKDGGAMAIPADAEEETL